MKSKVIFQHQDQEAIEKAQNLGMAEPKPTERLGDFYFDIEYIHAAYLNHEKDIIIFLPSGSWILNYDESLWDKIKTYLNNK